MLLLERCHQYSCSLRDKNHVFAEKNNVLHKFWPMFRNILQKQYSIKKNGAFENNGTTFHTRTLNGSIGFKMRLHMHVWIVYIVCGHRIWFIQCECKLMCYTKTPATTFHNEFPFVRYILNKCLEMNHQLLNVIWTLSNLQIGSVRTRLFLCLTG